MRNKSQQATADTAVVVFLLLLVAMPLRFGQFHRLDRRSSSSLEVEEAHRWTLLDIYAIWKPGCSLASLLSRPNTITSSLHTIISQLVTIP